MDDTMKLKGKDAGQRRPFNIRPFDPRLSLRPAHFDISSLAARDDEGFELDFFEQVIAKDPCNEDALMLLGHVYTRRGEYRKGLDIDRRLVRLRPGDPTAYYNLACSYALLQQLDDAFSALDRAVTLGYRDVAHLLKDPDLDNLREDSRFRPFLSRVVGRSTSNS